jgi:RHS repeat-associated protein
LKNVIQLARQMGRAFLCLLNLAPAAHAAVGHTPGSFAVSPTGAATYTIPIWAPPGPGAVQPTMALTYNSQQGNSMLGVGWSLSGLSSIYRCNRTYAQDGAGAPVALSTADGLCLDGKRLRLTSGTYGQAGSTYQTEIADFSNVTAYGTAGNGPAYWIVKDRNGRSYQYGIGGNSQVLASGTTTALSWMVNSVSDPAGNTMTVSYNTATGTAVPNVISWTPSAYGSTSYNYTMTFGYGPNVPQSSYYGSAAGTSVVNTNLLGSITIAYTGTTVKKYVLSYQTSPTTGRDELTTVQECADSGATNCLSVPTTITYPPNNTAGVSSSATSAAASSGSGTPYSHYDLNGDGYPDLIFVNGTTWYVAFGSVSGYGTPQSTGISSSTTMIPGDLLANGHDGLLANNGGTWYYYSWNGSGFNGVSTGLAYDTNASQWVMADINGDGLPDLIELASNSTQIFTRLNTSSGSSPSFSATLVLAYDLGLNGIVSAQITSGSDGSNSFGTLRSLDFNGDGRADLALTTLVRYASGQQGLVYTELLSNGSTFTASVIGGSSNLGTLPILSFVNWNSDACTDYILGSADSLGATLYISGCNGSVTSTVSLGGVQVEGVMDWDGDGRTDLLVANGGNIGVYLSTGTGFSNLISTSIPLQDGVGHFYTFFTFDANADGLDDLGERNPFTGAISFYTHNGAGQPPDLVTSITDGYGNSASPTYVSIMQSNYSPGSFNPTYASPPTSPYRLDTTPRYVVNQATLSDPSSASNGTYQQTFWYYEAWMNVDGYGFSGFRQFQRHDSRTGLWETLGFDGTFPYSFSLAYDITSHDQAGNQVITFKFFNYPTVLLDGTPNNERWFVYFNTETEQIHEVGGTKDGQLIKTLSTSYTYDNYGNAMNITKVVTDNDSGSPYFNDTWTTTIANTPDVSTSTWCLGLSTQTQVSYTASIGASVTRTQQYTPDTTNCRYTQVVTEPNSSTYKATEALGYDSFGNVNSDSVTGVGMTARSTTMNWGTTGQFPMSVTDPSGATTTYNYNFSYGLPSSVTDANGITTSWQYSDGFGRVTQVNKPDGTAVSITYNACAPPNTCQPLWRSFVWKSFLDKSGNTINKAVTTYDAADRPMEDSQLTLAGLWTVVLRTYDSMGRLSSRTEPFFSTGTPYASTYSYDILNRITQLQRPISSTNSTLQSIVYDHEGRTTIVTDPQTKATTIVNDVNGWRRQTKDANGYTLTFGYDAAGSQASVTDSSSNNLWSGTYQYGTAPFLVNETDMDRGAWTYTVDALGERTGWKDAKSQSFSQSYDALSRPLTRTEPDLFTQWAWGSTPASHNVGRLQSVCTGMGANPITCAANPGYGESEAYDSLGRLYQRAIAIPSAGTFTYTWLYNGTTGLLDTLTYPVSTSSQALVLKYAYQNGYLQSITDTLDSPNVTVWQANSTDPTGQLTQETLGNGLVTNRNFDAVTHWLGSVQSGVGGGTGVENLGFLYDLMGNVTQRQDNNHSLTENIFYDNLYRFSYSTLLIGTQNEGQNLSVHYDLNGNITSRSDVASGANWTYDPVRKHAVTQAGSSSFSYAYDANGNMNSRQGLTVQWSSYNYPLSVSAGSGSTAENVSFAYGPGRQRWQQSYTGNSTTETTDYVGGLLEIVAAGGVTDYRHYINAGSEPVAVYSRKSTGVNTFSYLLSDHQGSIASITNSSGTAVVGESFTPFGNRRDPTTWSGAASNADLTASAGVTRQGYTFQTALGSWMGLNHMNGRVQDAITGRFISADPGGTSEDLTQSWNRYSYVANNPLTYADPTGFVEDSNKPIDPEDLNESLTAAFSGGASLLSSWETHSTCSYEANGALLGCKGGASFSFELLGGSPDGGASGGDNAGSSVGGPGGANGGLGSGSRGGNGPPSQIPCRAGVNCYSAPQGNPGGKCYSPFAGGDSFSSEFAARLANLAAGLADSLSIGLDLGPQISGSVNIFGIKPSFNAGLFNGNLSLTGAGNLTLSVRSPVPDNLGYAGVSLSLGPVKVGAASSSVVEGVSTRTGPFAYLDQGFSGSATVNSWSSDVGKLGANLQAGIGVKVQFDLANALKALGCATSP